MRPLLLSLALSGCAFGLQDATHLTGSSSLAVSTERTMFYALDTDAGAVLTVRPSGAVVDRLELGVEPMRVARAGDLVFVTLRGQAEIVVLERSGVGLVEVDRIAVGAEPFGLVASEDGASVFVAISLADEVLHIDVASLEVTQRYAMGGQPRFLALHPSGQTLYVGSSMGGGVHAVDVASGEVTPVAIPQRERLRFADGQFVPLVSRVTGDLSISPRGDQLAVPMMYVDTSLPPEGGDVDGEIISDGYANSGPDPVGRTTPVVVFYDIARRDGSNPREDAVVPVVTFSPDFDFDIDDDGNEFVRQDARRGYVSSVTYTPDSLAVLATMESSAAVLVVPAVVPEVRDRRQRHSRGVSHDAMPVMPHVGGGFGGSEGFEIRPIETIMTAAGPRGVAFIDENTPVLDVWLDHGVQRLPFSQAMEALSAQLSPITESHGRAMAEPMGFGFTWLQADPVRTIAEASLDPEVEIGRHLFYSAVDARMSGHGSGTACVTCHFDGRNDGLTWALPDGDLQTPSLAGRVSDTAPVTWLSSVPSVAEEAMLTSSGRMGGSGLTEVEAMWIQRFVDSTPYPTVAALDAGAVERGRAIFHGSAQCATCHTGELLTDNQPYPMFGLPNVRTPTLRGVAATAPYLHDGRAATLEELIDITEAGGMGRTSHLSTAEKADLVAYLKAL
jgi:mono/diheme cytochrome c family protein